MARNLSFLLVSVGIHLLVLLFSEGTDLGSLEMRRGIEVVVFAERGEKRPAPVVKSKAGSLPAGPSGGSPTPSASPGVSQGGVEWGFSAPEYPEVARRRGEEGDVLLQVGFTEEGKPVSVSLQQTSGFPLLDQAAVESVRRLISAAPGSSAKTTKVIRIQFKLKD